MRMSIVQSLFLQLVFSGDFLFWSSGKGMTQITDGTTGLNFELAIEKGEKPYKTAKLNIRQGQFL